MPPTRADTHTGGVIPYGRCAEDSGLVADTTAPTKSLAVPLTAFAAGAVVAVLVGVFGKIHDPTLQGTTTLGFRTVIDMKVVLATVVGVLAVLQILGGLWIYGRLGRPAPAWVGPAHRISGAIAVILAVFVAYSCLWALGLESGTLKNGEPVGTRTVVHGVLGCAVMGAFVVKAAAVRSRRAPGLVPAPGRWAALRAADRRGADLGRLVPQHSRLADGRLVTPLERHRDERRRVVGVGRQRGLADGGGDAVAAPPRGTGAAARRRPPWGCR